MKAFFTIIFTSWMVSAYAQLEVNIIFWDECSESFRKLEYTLYDVELDTSYLSENSIVKVPSQGYYLLDAPIINGDYLSSASTNLNINKPNHYIDTINIPRIRFTGKNALHSKYWNYFNCDNLCDGHEVCYYPNGNKYMEGNFLDGKPSDIIEYWENGNVQIKYWFKQGYMDYTRVEHYNKNGRLDKYETYVIRKRKTICRVYNSKGVLLDKSTQRFTIVK